MPGRINDDDIQAVRERADIAAVVGDYTALKRAGTGWKGLCPFHQEKTPSFHVDSHRGLFHCFGCEAGGDAIAFLQRAEALTFPEAVERLAAMVGHELRYEALSPG
ncbi:MAG: CHC2 zinc finger domain-containing protein, partial [Actinomycetota bacterium]|nr:CHC2 zinc finger domain-containing protein [Actinomycetota bacterium]